MANVDLKPISRLLVANRGEIARRIFRTAKDMGIATVAVYADGDANAPFVHEADTAIALNGTTSLETYLDKDKVLAACEMSGADAIHPGYGFLSENAEFANAVMEAGITWVGPPVGAISQMGDKLAAKSLMTEAGVPTLDAYELKSDSDIAVAAESIGYPVLAKASAGGGGRGMRVVEEPDDLEAAVEGAKREAGSAFGDDTVFLERWLTASRHVEIQILGDLHGNLVHFFERECSIQRRHQKIIEEAPSPAVDEALRAAMGEAAVAAAKKLGYASAGTVEFLVAGEEFWFLEVNTRLQVEHPITEEITGFDLVREQLRIAEGEPLGYEQGDLSINGHAIEARVYAENPARNFLPSPGTVTVWEPSDNARFDSGVESGSEVSVEFHPMIAKVISHAPTRRQAAAKLARALETTRIHGVTNNRDFLVATLRTAEFLQGDTTTDFIERVQPSVAREHTQQEVVDAALAASVFSQALRRKNAPVLMHISTGWRNSHMPPERVNYSHNGDEIPVEYRATSESTFAMNVAETNFEVCLFETNDDSVDMSIDSRRMSFAISRVDDDWLVHGPAGDLELTELPRFLPPGAGELEGGLIAPMPGRILATEVKAGETISSGQLLVILEAMKMEHRIFAPADGTVAKVNVEVGEQVEKDAVLIELEAEEED